MVEPIKGITMSNKLNKNTIIGDVDKVTAIVNKYTDSYQHRKYYYNKIKDLV